MIANVESGRKADVSTEQVVAIAWALGISPILLLVDLGRPYDPAPAIEGLTNVEMSLWILGEVMFAPPGTEFSEGGIPRLDRAQNLASERISAVKNIYRWRQRLAHLERQRDHQEDVAAKETFRREIDDVLEMIRDAEARLRENHRKLSADFMAAQLNYERLGTGPRGEASQSDGGT